MGNNIFFKNKLKIILKRKGKKIYEINTTILVSKKSSINKVRMSKSAQCNNNRKMFSAKKKLNSENERNKKVKIKTKWCINNKKNKKW